VKEIAFKLDLSHKTVHVHRANVLGKLQCHSTIDLVHFALDHQLLTGPSVSSVTDVWTRVDRIRLPWRPLSAM